jgi:uncharacterized membrane protein YtjA (UPF0391 family)
MLYYALACLVVALVTLVLGFAGIVRGAAGFANMALMASVVLLALNGIASLRRRHLHQH